MMLRDALLRVFYFTYVIPWRRSDWMTQVDANSKLGRSSLVSEGILAVRISDFENLMRANLRESTEIDTNLSRRSVGGSVQPARLGAMRTKEF